MLPHRSFTTGIVGMACCIGLFWQVRGETLLPPAAPVEGAVAPGPAAGAGRAERPGAAERDDACPLRAPAVNVIDVAAAAATPALVAQLIRVGEGEWVTAVDDHTVASDLEAGASIAARFQRGAADLRVPLAYPRGPLARGDYLDVTIERAGGSRRVLVLLH